MTYITSLSVQNFRNHTEKTIKLEPETTIVTGMNGAGKTSLIEAIYVALRGVSFRGTDKDILKKDKDWYRIDIDFNDGSQRIVKYEPAKATSKKSFIVSGKTSYRLSPSSKYPIILFEPEDLRLIGGSPARRRLFIDNFISQVDIEYHTAARKYERALKQRNNLLKRKMIHRDELFVWDIALSEYGAYMIGERIAFIEKINQSINPIYQSIANTNDAVSIHYSRTLIDGIKQKLMSELSINIERDKILGYTTVGPHRDDIVFQYNGVPAIKHASRGENRTIILALKRVELDIVQDITGLKPVVLLDDVLSELDEHRYENLLQPLVYNQAQTIVTTTHMTSDKYKTTELG